jgi:hypothetical protein
MLTTLVIRAFFESHFASEPGVRADHEKFLVRILPAELPEVTYVPSCRARAHRRSTGIRTPSELTARSE